MGVHVASRTSQLSALCAFTFPVLLAFTSQAVAQTAAAPAGLPPGPASDSSPSPEEQQSGIGDIVVTAQKRSENLQRVPISITALSSAALQERGVTNISQIAAYAPNVDIKNTVSFAGSSQILVASIRGIGQSDFAFNLEPGVGVYIDGVYFARSLGAVVDLLDLERIEVLKGPQGTLFGRNTIGGALSVITRDPGNDVAFALEGTTGSFSRTDVRASVDLPLVGDTLLSQFSVSYKHRDGYQRRIPFPGAAGKITDRGSFLLFGSPGGSQRQGGENALNARAKLLWRASDNVRLLISADYTRADQEARPTTLVKTFGEPTDGTIYAAYNGCIFGAAPSFICSARGRLGTSFFGVNVDANPNNDRLPLTDAYVTGDKDTNYSAGSNFDQLTAWGVSGTLTWDFADSMSLKSITAYRHLQSDFGVDVAPTPIVGNDATFSTKQRQFSQELNFNADLFDNRLKSVIGLYYFNEKGSLTDELAIGEGLIQIYGPNFFKNSSFAAFAQENFAITDRWSVTGGIRYTRETKRFQGEQRDLNSFFIRSRGVDPNGPLPPAIVAILPDPTDRTRLYPVGVNQLKFTNTSFKVGTEFKVSDQILAYYSFSQGFKSGGWTTRLLDVIPTNDARDLTFRPEKADSHEIGIKSTLFDRRLRLNAAAFSTAYKDMQVTTYNGISPVFSNAGKSRLRGFELEAQSQLGALSLNAALGYLDARYVTLAPGTSVKIGNDLVNAPKWSGSLGANYAVTLLASSKITLASDYSYKSNTHPDAENSPYLQSGNVGLWNASLSYTAPQSVWSLTGGVRNITDKRYVVGGFDQSQAGQIGFVSVSYSPPRQWFLTLRVKQ